MRFCKGDTKFPRSLKDAKLWSLLRTPPENLTVLGCPLITWSPWCAFTLPLATIQMVIININEDHNKHTVVYKSPDGRIHQLHSTCAWGRPTMSRVWHRRSYPSQTYSSSPLLVLLQLRRDRTAWYKRIVGGLTSLEDSWHCNRAKYGD